MTHGIARRGMMALVAGVAVHPALAAGSYAADPSRNVDASGLALHGFDPVAYFTDSRPVEGDATITTEHQGSTYRFFSEAHRARFVADPERYVPRYGGFCAYAVANGYKADIDPDAWTIVDGRLYLNYDETVSARWRAGQAAYIVRADENWPKIGSVAAKDLD